ncbi:MAG TPA: nuclear transport factor 2 family protein [Candidatus Eisenbacteria bacterium]|nr:nuclear transport factor 2 family protein [Candidatus Eisenbacteria bacterium]
MKKLPLITLLLLLSAGSSLAVDAGTTDEIKNQLDAQYQKLSEAHDRQDLPAILSLKTPDFHAIFPDGRVGDAKVMAEYSKQFITMNKPPYGVRVIIQSLAVSDSGLIAVAEVSQEATRMRELAGTLRRVDTSVRQRETWLKTPEGWKLKCVDSVRDQKRFVDGKRVDPTKPYNPNDPPFQPDSTGTDKP